MTTSINRPDTYRASLALAQPLIQRWRALGCKDGQALIEDEVCPACGGTIHLFKATWAMALTGRCSTPFCINFSE